MYLKFKDYILRAAFALALIGAGFAAERTYYRFKSNAPKETSPANSNRLDLLIAGGSIAHGIDSYLEKHLRRMLPKISIQVSSFSIGGFQTLDTILYHDELTRKFRPHFILLLLNCFYDETVVQSTLLETVNSTKMARSFFELLKVKDTDVVDNTQSTQLARHLVQVLETAILRRESLRIMGLKFLPTSFFEKLHPSDLVYLDGFIETQIRALQNSNMDDWQDWRLIEALLGEGYRVRERMAALNINLSPYEDYFYSDYRRGFKKEDLQNLAARFEVMVAQRAKEYSSQPCPPYDSQSKTYGKYDHYWLCTILTRANRPGVTEPKVELKDMISRARYYFLSLPKPLYKSLALTQKDFPPGMVGEAMVRLSGPAEPEASDDEPGPEFTEEQINTYIGNLSQFKKSAEAKGEKIILLQSPNIRSMAMVRASKKLGLPVIDNRGIFNKKIDRDGYNTYFVDRMCGTGHMTELSKDIYAEHLARELLPLLNVAP